MNLRYALSAVAGCLVALAGAALLAGATGSASVAIPLTQEGGVLFVRAELDGRGPMLMTFDPGGEDMYTSDARSALNGRAPHTLCLATACVSVSMEYLDGDPNQLDPRHDVRRGVISGSIGPALLARYVATVDYRASTLTLTPASEFRPPPGAQRLPMTVDSNGMPVVPAAIDGFSVPVEVDVRAPTSMLFAPFLERTHLDQSYAQAPVVKRSASMTAHAVGSVRIGSFELHDIPFWFSTATTGKFADAKEGGLLGNDVLSQFVVTLDLAHRYVYLVSVEGG